MRVDVDGGRLYLVTAGRGSPILMLHGWSLDHRVFEPQLRYLERSFHVIAFDRRGFGRSEAPPDLGRELEDLDRVFAALGLTAVHLLGMSQGARIALRFAATRPQRIRSLILQAPVIDGVALEEGEAERIPLEEFAALARAGRMDEVRRRWLAHPMMTPGAAHPALRRLVTEIVNDYAGNDLLTWSPAHRPFPHDVLQRLSGLELPCLILTGTHETASRRGHARKLIEALPGAREVVFRHSGHLSNLTEAEAYNRQVAEFCASVDAGTAARDT